MTEPAPPGRPPRRGPFDADPRKIGSRLIAFAVAVATIAAVRPFPLFEPFVQYAPAMIAAMVIVLELLVNVPICKATGAWDHPADGRVLSRIVRVRLALLAAVAIAGFAFHPSATVTLSEALALIPVWLSFFASNWYVRRHLGAPSRPGTHSDGFEQPARRPAPGWQVHPGEPDRRDRPAHVSVTLPVPHPIAALLRRLEDSPAVGTITITAAAYLAGLGLMLSASGAVADYAFTGAKPAKARRAKNSGGGAAGQGQFNGGTAAGTPPGNASSSASSSPSRRTAPPPRAWNGRCTRPEGANAPSWAYGPINTLYEGEETVGPKIAGCTGEPEKDLSQYGLFVWMYGENPVTGQTLSIAVDGPHYGAALFLWPAVVQIHRLIERYKAIGGAVRDRFKRIEVLGGDFYPVETSDGTYILIRATTGTETNGHAYIELPPTVAEAWVSTMNETSRWLWPMPPTSADGTEAFSLATASHPDVARYTIFYAPPTERAELAGRTYLQERRRINTEELEEKAKQASNEHN